MRHFSMLALAGIILLGGCAAAPRDRGSDAINELLTARGAPAATWSPDTAPPQSRQSLSRRDAVERAFVTSPLLREQYAELGLGAADIGDALKLPNPALGFSRLEPAGGSGTQITRSVSLVFSNLLLMRSRSNVARANFSMTRDRVAARLLELESEVSAAWFEYAAAQQAVEVQDTATRAARASAEYARRLRAAGNLPARDVARELADSARSDIALARARAAALESRAKLAALMGLSVQADWQVAARLPSLPSADEMPANLEQRAQESRLDLAAAKREAAALESIWRATRAWRWLGEFEVGYERETERDGAKLSGPTFRLTLPLFNQNQGGVLRARAALESSQARLGTLELEVRNGIALSLDRMATARGIADIYRSTLLPQREAVSARTQEEVNFMLVGAFEALAARREQFDAYQEYIDAVRDYWLARTELRRVSGGILADADTDTAETLNLESAPPANVHEHHGAHP
jgi:cobalt-zinc-cadmium efflux system outer membrane protein